VDHAAPVAEAVSKDSARRLASMLKQLKREADLHRAPASDMILLAANYVEASLRFIGWSETKPKAERVPLPGDVIL